MGGEGEPLLNCILPQRFLLSYLNVRKPLDTFGGEHWGFLKDSCLGLFAMSVCLFVFMVRGIEGKTFPVL